MKRIKSYGVIVLSISLLLCSSGCGKSSDVKRVEELINGIGEVSLSSADYISEALEAYEDLSDADKNKVANYDDLMSASDEYDELIDEAVSDANDLYRGINEALDDYDLDEAYECLDELENIYNSLPEDNRDDVSFDMDISTMRNTLDNLCYPGTDIWQLNFVVGSTGMTGIEDDDVAPRYSRQYYYNYSNGETALAAASSYIDYLNDDPSISYESFDRDINLVTYSYPGGHIELFTMNFGSSGGSVSVGFY